MPDDRTTVALTRAEPLPGEAIAGFARTMWARARHFWVPMSLAFLIPAVLGIAIGLRSKPVYTAQARLLVLYADDYVFHPGDRGTGNDITFDRNQVMQAELQILQSPALATQALDAVGARRVYPTIPPDEADVVRTAAERLSKDLTVSTVPQSNIIELSMRSPSRETAVATLSAMIDKYLPYRASVFEKSQSEQAGQETALFARRLQAAEENLSRFGSEHGITNLDEQTSLLLRQRAEIANTQRQVAEQTAEAQAKLEGVRAQLRTVQQTVPIYTESTRSQQVSGLTESYVKLTSRRQEMQSQYTPNSPVLQDMDRQIAALRAQIGGSPTRDGAISRVGRNTMYDDLKAQESTLSIQVQGFQARQTALAAQAEQIGARSNELASLSQPYRDLQRTRDVLDQSYRAISRSNEESQLANALHRAAGANVRVVQPPDAPLKGTSLRRVLAVGGVVVGLMAAAATLALASLFAPHAHRKSAIA